MINTINEAHGHGAWGGVVSCSVVSQPIRQFSVVSGMWTFPPQPDSGILEEAAWDSGASTSPRVRRARSSFQPRETGQKGQQETWVGAGRPEGPALPSAAAALSKSAASGWASASPVYGVGLLNRVQGTRMFHAYSTKDSVNHQLTL